MENNTNILSVSIEEYKAKIKELEESLKGLKTSSAEYKKTLEEIEQAQKKLNDALSVSTKSVSELNKNLSNVKQVDVGKSTDSLKEFKKETDNMKVALIGLDENSEEYSKLLNEIKERQTKLNEVMAIGKKKVDATVGSYNDIQQQVRELVKENKNLEGGLTDNAEQFQKNAQEINKLNEKLKEADAQMGYFQRNVGDYKNSFLKAFEEMKGGPVGVIQGLNTLGENIKGMIIKNGSLGKSFKAVGDNIKTNLITALNVLVKHPIVATITLLGALIAGLISKINMSAKATKAWERAMSAFQPVLNMVQNAIGFLVEKVADCADWFAKKLPNAIRGVTKAFSGGLRGVANFVEGFTKMPSVFKQVFSTIVKIATSGISGLLKGIETLANALGLDGIAKKIRSAFDFINNMSFDDQIKSISNGINSLADSIDNIGNNIAQVQEDAYNRTVRQQKLNKALAQEQLNDVKEEIKYAELRDKIAKASGKERLNLLKQLRNEIVKDGQEDIRLAKERLRLAKEQASLAPNSKEDNARLRELEQNVLEAEKKYKDALVGVDRLTTRTEQSIVNEANKASKEKERLTEKEYQTRARYYQNIIQLDKIQLANAIKGSNEEYQLQRKLIEDEYKANLNKINKEIKDEAEKLNAIKLLNENKNAALIKADNDFWYQTQTQALSNFRTIVETLDKTSDQYSLARLELAKKEINFQIESWDRAFKQFAKSETENVKNIWNAFTDSSNISMDDMKEKFQTLIAHLGELKEEAEKKGRTFTMNDIYNFLGFDPKDTKTKDAINELFKGALDGLDMETFFASYTSQLKKVSNVEQEEVEKIAREQEKALKNIVSEKLLTNQYNNYVQYYSDLVRLAKENGYIVETIKRKENESEQEYNKRLIDATSELYNAYEKLAESYTNGANEFNARREQEEREHSSRMIDIGKELYDWLQNNQNESEEEKLKTQEAYNKRIEDEEKRHSKAMVKIDNDQAKKQKMTTKQWFDVSAQYAQGVSTVLNNVASIKQANLEQDVENGKISEEQAKEEFENLKKFQIAAATIDMLSSLVAVNYSIWSDKSIPSVWAKIALSAIQSAAILTSGQMNIQQIKQTEFGGSGGSGGNTSANRTVDFSTVNVNPLLNENADMANVQNVNVVSDQTSGGDQRVYILQSDINKSNKQVELREKNTTF